MPGLSGTGFEIETIEEIVGDISSAMRTKISPTVDTSAQSVLGQLAGIYAEREYNLWVAVRDVLVAFTVAGATGQALTDLCILTGVLRLSATKSRVTATVNLNGGVTLPAGSQARVTSADVSFETIADVTNAGGSPADVAVVMEAVETGAVRANAGTLTEIVTPVVGWNSITNALDADMGQDDESDTALRLRRETELRIQGSGSIDAIQADVSRIDGVISARATENTGAHTFNVVIWDGDPSSADDDEIAQAIWDSKPAGIESTGSDTGTAVDINGLDRTVAFDRAEELEVYITFNIVTDPDTFPVDGVAQLKDAVVAFGDLTLTVGGTAYTTKLYAPAYGIAGVVDVSSIRIGTSPSPAFSNNINPFPDQIVRFDTSRIVVNVT